MADNTITVMPDHVAGDSRFWSKVVKGADDECWVWIGGINEFGYGNLRRDGRTVKAHRYVLGEPDGIVYHHCDCPPCVNPRHLAVGTQADNIHDMCAKGRHAPTGSPGERNPNRKLSVSDVVDIRGRFANGETLRSIASAFEVAPETASTIVRGITWPSAPGPITRNRPGRRQKVTTHV